MPDSRRTDFHHALVFDTGLRSALANMEVDQLLLAKHREGRCGDLLRFHRSHPAACVGRHQRIGEHVREGFCTRRGIDIVRRVSGGGALYLDPGQQGISLLVRRRQPWGAMKSAALLEYFCRALGDALKVYGIETAFSFPNDLEIGGRKCASVFLASAQDSLLFYATVLLDMDIGSALCALRVPTEKLSPDGLADARERSAPLAPLLASAATQQDLKEALAGSIAASFALDLQPADAGGLEELSASRGDLGAQPRSSGEVSGTTGSEAVWRTSGGALRAIVMHDPETGVVARAELDADVQVFPHVLFEQVQEAVVGRTPCMIEGAVHRIFSTCKADPVGFSAADVARVLKLALETDAFKGRHGLHEARLMLYDGCSGTPVEMALAGARAMLVPYCAKPNWCKWRHQDGCSECGLCEVGEAYRLGRERDMAVITVTSFEHLRATLRTLKSCGAQAYVGMCCKNFFVKRHAAFQEAGIPALLMDISGSNCYELRQEDLAYAGKFEANATLDGALLSRVMRLVPLPAAAPGQAVTAPTDPEK